ncbi:MAG TPA: YraN family protein [Rhodocyclaceae bacterium]|nr:YraN family protein [Rhodocyclaceae bacterium]
MSSGKQAEDLAVEYLKRQGVKLLARNVRCAGGEVDVIGELRGTILFVEVRLRTSTQFGGAAASITRAKQKRVILAAQHWLIGPGQRHANRPCRFDAVLLNGLDTATIEWLPGAFSAD